MPEPGQDDSSERTVPESEYKKLQRTLERRNRAVSKLEERMEAFESGINRIESLLEGVGTAVSGMDDQSGPAVKELISTVQSRRKADLTSAQLTARLNQILDESDADWEDEKFDSARQLLEQINSTGDLTRAAELERIVQDAVRPPAEDFEARVAAAVESKLAELRGGARVDTGESTVSQGRIRRADLAFDPKRDGVEGLRERANRALEQLTG